MEYGHIFAYFIRRPGLYTREQLISWKQLDAYNYFQAGYVRNVLSKGFSHDGSTFCLLKAKLASQKSPDLAHEAWIVAKQDGDIISTCVHRILLNA